MAKLLMEQEIFPSSTVLENEFGKEIYSVFGELETHLTQAEYGLTFNWLYQHKIHSWLCSVCCQTKIVFWISAWNGFLKIFFNFTQEEKECIVSLEINETIKEDLRNSKLSFTPLNISQKGQLPDLLKIIKFKLTTISEH